MDIDFVFFFLSRYCLCLPVLSLLLPLPGWCARWTGAADLERRTCLWRTIPERSLFWNWQDGRPGLFYLVSSSIPAVEYGWILLNDKRKRCNFCPFLGVAHSKGHVGLRGPIQGRKLLSRVLKQCQQTALNCTGCFTSRLVQDDLKHGQGKFVWPDGRPWLFGVKIFDLQLADVVWTPCFWGTWSREILVDTVVPIVLSSSLLRTPFSVALCSLRSKQFEVKLQHKTGRTYDGEWSQGKRHGVVLSKRSRNIWAGVVFECLMFHGRMRRTKEICVSLHLLYLSVHGLLSLIRSMVINCGYPGSIRIHCVWISEVSDQHGSTSVAQRRNFSVHNTRSGNLHHSKGWAKGAVNQGWINSLLSLMGTLGLASTIFFGFRLFNTTQMVGKLGVQC